ncbi:DUF563 domain-containing protein [Sphingomonas sp. BK069]|uniref:glycosyltransferase family 61 protein n=1 Tax=Sphingomonas sp. BK069 TaxID=2586979 RepID=UPI00161031CF|nr:glycosyltransferase family 61 protein [Sphingomonas sp. BK069]MBB3349620.1 capsular polysaccharide biosynthesis protein [Sphingomonas sp. BK069]
MSDPAVLPFICCAARQTYGIGALPAGLDADAPGAGTADPAAFGIHTLEEVYNTVRYHWRPFPEMYVNPGPFTDELARFYAGQVTRNCPASVLVRIEDAVLAHSVLYARGSSDAPAIVYETYRPNDRPALPAIDRGEIARADRARFADRDWATLFVGSAGSSNYGHWLVDDLPRLKGFEGVTRHAGRPVRVAIPGFGGAIDAVRIESIRLLLGESVHIDLIDPNVPQHIPDLYYVTPVTQHPLQKSPAALDRAARDVLARLAQAGSLPNGPLQLFVLRTPRYGRGLANEGEIRALVAARGFTLVDPDGLSFAEQVQLFAGAQVVIGQMGAAMTNTLFCRPTTTVIHLAPTGWIEPFYWDLAAVRGHHYRVIYGDVSDAGAAPHLSGFTVDPASVEAALAAL